MTVLLAVLVLADKTGGNNHDDEKVSGPSLKLLYF